ncbi:ABC transporter ATP-binding protein, partial [Streptococcus sobrinus]|uniref:ABC transporter ATP-binding protein n=1 Tax=Streptococcus sobrinus TaxID=1310 RepID=UPI00049270ED
CIRDSRMAINGDITMGTIVAFMTYVRIFTQPISQIAQGITQLQSANAAMGRVFEFLDEEEMEVEDVKAKQLDKVKGDVAFENVFFGYNPDKTIIHDFSAKAKPGQKIAIVGPTGAGKTTMVNLLMRFYEINKGRISIDGVNIHDMKRSEVHDAFSMVLQDTWLFEGTVKENLIFNQEHITDEQVLAATKAVGVHHYIKTLPKGYDTVLDDSVTLSVGQKQLMTIARALLKDSPLLILDEATSSVDTRTEELIQKAMDKLMEGRTSFVIAHRLSTIRNADLILVMKDGNIIEQGNHQELMTQNGFYADLYNSQFASA